MQLLVEQCIINLRQLDAVSCYQTITSVSNTAEKPELHASECLPSRGLPFHEFRNVTNNKF